MDMKREFLNYIREHEIIARGDRVLLGLSGGPDSVCLLLLLNDVKEELGIELSAMYVDHGIRGRQSEEDGAFAGRLCERLKVPFFSAKADVPGYVRQTGESLEEAARKLRYEALFEQARLIGEAKIAVAHNLRDQAETLLFRMIRGSGPKGMAGMRPVSGIIIRPLLFADKPEILSYLEKRGQDYRTDATNLDTDYSRNRIRQKVIPELLEINSGAVRHIGALADKTAELTEYESLRAAKYVAANMKNDGGHDCISTEDLCGEAKVFRTEVVREFIARCGCSLKDISGIHYEAAEKLIDDRTGKILDLPGGIFLQKGYGSLILEKYRDETSQEGTASAKVAGRIEIKTFPMEKDFNLCTKLYTKWFDYDKISKDISLRTRQAGDYIVIHPDGRKKKLKTWFIDEKVPGIRRDQIPLVAAGDEILWIVGFRTGESARISGTTRTVMQIDYIQEVNGHG